jgi:hypothetical protein
MQKMRLQFVLGCVVLGMSGTGLAQTSPSAVRPSPPAARERVVLVELFTSEGCSSCPPADDLLRKIDGKHISDGTLLVGISEHVNYWDHGGWKDPFDSSAITDRQSQYGDRFHLDSVYTPQMVVNGSVQFVGSDAKSLVKAIGDATLAHGPAVKIVSSKVEGNSVVMTVSVAGELPKGGVDLFAVIAQDETTRNVAAGENRGRTLVHAAVARSYEKSATIEHAGATTVRMVLPDDLKTTSESRRHLIIWAQESNLGPVLGVDTATF